VDSIEGGDAFNLLEKYRIKHRTLDVPDTIFGIVQDGMQGTMEFGTGAAAKVPGIVVCGKTGTVENAYKGEKQKDHAFFGAFAPRDHPRIAIAVMCENAGFGATSAAPIASLMIEKYLNDTIAENRKEMVERVEKMNLIPARMLREIRVRDSISQAKAIANSKLEEEERKALRDSLALEDEPEEIKEKKTSVPVPAKDSGTAIKPAAVLPGEKKKNKPTDSLNKN
jgi:penicillin-binding protein 2